MQSKLPLQKQRVRGELLLPAIERLRRAIAENAPGRERQWAANVSADLMELESALRQHIKVAEEPDGVFSEVDEERPTLARQVDGLRREHGEYLDQVIELRAEVARVAEAFDPARSVNNGPSQVPNISELRTQVEKVLASLEQNKEAETKLVLESINTDIGAGD